MKRYYHTLLATLLFANIYLASARVAAPRNALVFENEPYTNWECQTAQGQTTLIQSQSILQSINRLVNLWDRKTHDQWADSPYPQRVPTSQISDWPESTDDPDDPDWLCNLNKWVGSYPVTVNHTETADPGPFRALVSSSYKKEGTGGDVSYIFAFCGVVVQTGNNFEMCWPLEEDDEEQSILS
ncbi:hypothetical protein FRC07_006005 [Ceratobasidium sp. 392]|nr:hypothetical protein FRC07_006005 [Ceratobasidium sp. 392]